jgi:hypothetical protein
MGDVVSTGAVAYARGEDEQATSVVGIDGEEEYQTYAEGAEVVASLEAVSIQVEAEVEAE